jgi:hypothetical protein
MGRINMAVRFEARELKPKALNCLQNPMDQKWYLFFIPSKGAMADLELPYVKAPVLDHKASEISGELGCMPQ